MALFCSFIIRNFKSDLTSQNAQTFSLKNTSEKKTIGTDVKVRMIKIHHQDAVQTRQNNIKILPEKIELCSFISTNLKMPIKSERGERLSNQKWSLINFIIHSRQTNKFFKMNGHIFFGINCLLYKCIAIKKYSIEKSWLNFYN